MAKKLEKELCLDQARATSSKIIALSISISGDDDCSFKFFNNHLKNIGFPDIFNYAQKISCHEKDDKGNKEAYFQILQTLSRD